MCLMMMPVNDMTTAATRAERYPAEAPENRSPFRGLRNEKDMVFCMACILDQQKMKHASTPALTP
jgi:hypothetical protein